MKKFITLLFVFAVTLQVSAQTDPVKSQLDHIFQYINKSQVPTAYLDQYGAQFVNKKFFNGVLSNDNLIRDLAVF